MGGPGRGWVLRAVELDGEPLPLDAEVAVHRRDARWAEVAFDGRRGRVPSDAVGDEPYAGPPLEALRRLDACFGLPDAAFARVYIDRDNFFEVVRCRAHGRRFLRDVVGTFAQRTRLTLLADGDPDAPLDVWRAYHDQTDAWHARRGRTY